MDLSKYVGSKIKYYREIKNLTQDELAEILSTTRQSISRYENGERKANQDILFELSDVFNVSINDFFPEVREVSKYSIETIYNQLNEHRQTKVYNYTTRQLEEQNNNVASIEKNKKVFVLGKTAANPSEISYGDAVFDETIDTNVPRNADCALVIQGDSMQPLLQDGSIVFYKQQPEVENGEVAIVELDGNGVTCKKVYFDYDSNVVTLKSINDKYDDRNISPERVRVIGKVLL